MPYIVASYDSDGSPLEEEEHDTMDDCYATVDQFIIDGAHTVEVLNSSGDVIHEYHNEWE